MSSFFRGYSLLWLFVSFRIYWCANNGGESESSVIQKVAGQFQFSTGFPQGHLAHNRNMYSPSIFAKNFHNVNYVNGDLQTSLMQPYRGTCDLPMVSSVSPVPRVY